MSNQNEQSGESDEAKSASRDLGGGDRRRRGLTPYRSRRATSVHVEASWRTISFALTSPDGEPIRSIDPSPYQDDMNRRLRRAVRSPRSQERVSAMGVKIAARGRATTDGRFGILIPPVPR